MLFHNSRTATENNPNMLLEDRIGLKTSLGRLKDVHGLKRWFFRTVVPPSERLRDNKQHPVLNLETNRKASSVQVVPVWCYMQKSPCSRDSARWVQPTHPWESITNYSTTTRNHTLFCVKAFGSLCSTIQPKRQILFIASLWWMVSSSALQKPQPITFKWWSRMLKRKKKKRGDWQFNCWPNDSVGGCWVLVGEG